MTVLWQAFLVSSLSLSRSEDAANCCQESLPFPAVMCINPPQPESVSVPFPKSFSNSKNKNKTDKQKNFFTLMLTPHLFHSHPVSPLFSHHTVSSQLSQPLQTDPIPFICVCIHLRLLAPVLCWCSSCLSLLRRSLKTPRRDQAASSSTKALSCYCLSQWCLWVRYGLGLMCQPLQPELGLASSVVLGWRN